jgi:sugar (pentulose or hexulose) kinase
MTILLGLDIGTTAIKAALYNTELGKIVRVASRPTPVSHPQEGWSEHDPSHLWDVTTACIREAAAGQPVAGIAISSMAEAGVWIDDCGRPLAPIIAWYDRRSEPQAARIEQVVPVDALYAITGQRASPSFGATKLLWLRENRPEIYARGTHWLPVPAYLLYRLCGEMAVDYTIAARTLLFDQNHLVWSQALLEALELSPTCRGVPSARWAGTITCARRWPLGHLAAAQWSTRPARPMRCCCLHLVSCLTRRWRDADTPVMPLCSINYTQSKVG